MEAVYDISENLIAEGMYWVGGSWSNRIEGAGNHSGGEGLEKNSTLQAEQGKEGTKKSRTLRTLQKHSSSKWETSWWVRLLLKPFEKIHEGSDKGICATRKALKSYGVPGTVEDRK